MLRVWFPSVAQTCIVPACIQRSPGTSSLSANDIRALLRDINFTPQRRHRFIIDLSSCRLDGSRAGSFDGELHRVVIKVVDVDAGVDDAGNTVRLGPDTIAGKLPQHLIMGARV